MDILSGATLAKSAIENVRSLVEVSKSFENVEFKRRIVDLEDQIAELARERRSLEEENHEQKQKLELRAKMHFRNPYWYEEGDEVPFCPKCYESSGHKLRVHLPHPPREWKGSTRRVCRTCEGMFYERA